MPADQLHPLIMIECPRLLFPFARQMVADAVRNGGFPPLYIDPIDFVTLYRQKAAEQGQAAPGQPGPAAAGGTPAALHPPFRGALLRFTPGVTAILR